MWLESIESEAEEAKTTQAKERKQRDNIREQIKQVKAANATITSDNWISKLKFKYHNLQAFVNRNAPELWPRLEFELSVLNRFNNHSYYKFLIAIRSSNYYLIVTSNSSVES